MIAPRQLGLSGFDVQYWNGSSWVTVPGGSVTGNNLVWRKFTFPAITTSKIRVLTNASASGWSRLTEVEAWTAGSGSSSSSEVLWLVSDHLGTPRMILDQTGSLANIKRHDYLPFREELGTGIGGRTPGQGYVGDNNRFKFATYERDAETGLDYAQARAFANTQGRFASPDPMLSSGDPAEPQSWNRYGYVVNNPLVYVDPSGLIWGYQDGTNANGDRVRTFSWFDGDQVDEGWTAYHSNRYVGINEVIVLASASDDYLRIARSNFTEGASPVPLR